MKSLSLLLMCCTVLVQAQNNAVYLQNNTDFDFGVEIGQSGSTVLPASGWQQTDSLSRAWQPKLQLLEVLADSPAILPGDTVVFDVALTLPGDSLWLKLRLIGQAAAANRISYAIAANGIADTWHDDAFFHQHTVNLAGEGLVVKYKLEENGTDVLFAVHDDLRYAVDPGDFADPNTINVLSYNVQMFPEILPTGLPMGPQRAQIIPYHLSPYDDVVVFQEVFDTIAAFGFLVENMEAAGYAYNSGLLNQHLVGGGTFVGGGVIVFSRWEIEATAQYDYETCAPASADCLSNKGVMYARINKLGKRYHIFGTHMEAGGNADDIIVKREQYGEARHFIDAQGIPAWEPVIFAGDFNVSPTDLAPEFLYDAVRDSLRPIIPHHLGPPYSTWNAQGNPNKFGRVIDHVWGIRDYLQPIEANNEVIIMRSVDSLVWQLFDLSDHLTAHGRFVYPDLEVPPQLGYVLCPGEPPGLSVPVAPQPETAFWELDDVFLAPGTSVSATSAGSYDLYMSDTLTFGNTNDSLNHLFYPDGPVTYTSLVHIPFEVQGFQSNPTIVQSGDALVSGSIAGNQWYSQDGLIIGATEPTYFPAEAGEYYVVVTAGGCVSNPSNTLGYVVGMEDLADDEVGDPVCYPNPNQSGLLFVEWQTPLPESGGEAELSIYDAAGARVLRQSFSGSLLGRHRQAVDVSQLNAGVYLLLLEDGGLAWSRRLLVFPK